MLDERRRNQLYGAVGVIVALCLAGSAVCAVTPTIMSRTALPFGYSMSVCYVWSTTPRFQAGIVWMSPFLSSVSPLGMLGRGCRLFPWLPFLPQRGELVFPP